MPELPEVECLVRDLQNCLVGRKILDVKFFWERMLSGFSSREFCRQVSGRVVQKIQRKGKYILIYLRAQKVLEIHLRMTGALLFYPVDVQPGRHTGAVFYLGGKAALHFEDMRKFGTFRLWDEQELPQTKPFLLGPDPLAKNFNCSRFHHLLALKPRGGIKSFLLNQENISGLGNIYTDETLFRAGIHPARKVGTLSREEEIALWEAMRRVLQEGIDLRGASVSDYRDLQGKPGEFQNMLQVYRRAGEKCPRCRGTIIRRVIAGRGTYLCPHCQLL
ncbi:MAG: bifunctional DNA-formamidopyrimidine glycosylase/DNA-(apurinic or apyrimidinic site) lyase [Firmicutes bacterium]|nr:bifunctional DNA-formamidopyrimidine glycosylase/DNA-(apurinic or apyrimidinic site) lyase [Bacillota bacterium]